MTYQQILGTRIRNFRKRAGFSQLALEIEIGSSAGTLSRIENGEVNPTKETLQRISDILELNQREIEYLHGKNFYPASEIEINRAKEEIVDYFKQRGVLAYMLDERNRLIHVSASFLKILELDENVMRKNYLKNWASIIIDDELDLRRFLSDKYYENAIYNVIERFHNDIYFMKDDKSYFDTIKSINNNKVAQCIWDKIVDNPPVYRTNNHRTIHFNFNGINIPLSYSVENLMDNRRFEIVEYQHSNSLSRLLSKFLFKE